MAGSELLEENAPQTAEDSKHRASSRKGGRGRPRERVRLPGRVEASRERTESQEPAQSILHPPHLTSSTERRRHHHRPASPHRRRSRGGSREASASRSRAANLAPRESASGPISRRQPTAARHPALSNRHPTSSSPHKRHHDKPSSPSPDRPRHHRHHRRSRSPNHDHQSEVQREGAGARSPRSARRDGSVTARHPDADFDRHQNRRRHRSRSIDARREGQQDRADRRDSKERHHRKRKGDQGDHTRPRSRGAEYRHGSARSPPALSKRHRSDKEPDWEYGPRLGKGEHHHEHRSRRSPTRPHYSEHPRRQDRHPHDRHHSPADRKGTPPTHNHSTHHLRGRSDSRERPHPREHDRNRDDDMYNRGPPYGPGYGYPPAQSPYGHQGYPPSGYPSHAPSPAHGYPMQQSPYPYQQPPPSHPGVPYYQQPRPSRQFSNPPPHSGNQTPQRGGPAIRGGRGHFANLSWTPGDGVRGGHLVQPGEKSREGSVTAPPLPPKESDPEDDENPFRPPADLRAEDESVHKKRKVSVSTAPAQDKAAKVAVVAKIVERKHGDADKEKNKISFSIKGRASASTMASVVVVEKISSTPRSEQSPLVAKKVPAAVSPLVQTTAPSLPKSTNYVGNKRVRSPAKSPPPVRRQKVRKKRLKARPELSEEYAQSESVYFRKTGNESVVGSGTYGKVYKAVHVYTGRMVALKKIRMEGERDGFPVTATREIKLLQSLKHVNVVALQEVMVERNDCFMVFEYLAHDLTGLLNHPSFTLTSAHKKHLAKQMFEGLDYLHRRGVLHRDIKAANILISKTGELKFADFGLARFYQKRQRQDYTNRVITIWYRSPELLLGETQYGPAVDIWSAACVLVEIFTRHAIFPGDGGEISQLDKIYAVLGTPSRSDWPTIAELQWYELLRPAHRLPSTFAEKYRERVSPEAFELLQAMLLYDPAARPTAADVLEHPYFTLEEPKAAQVWELEGLEGDWHEFESKALRKEKEKAEREARRRERDLGEKRKAEEQGGGEPKKAKVVAAETLA